MHMAEVGELRKEITNALTTPDVDWVSNMVYRASNARVQKALPELDIFDKNEPVEKGFESSDSPASFMQKLLDVLEEVADSH